MFETYADLGWLNEKNRKVEDENVLQDAPGN